MYDRNRVINFFLFNILYTALFVLYKNSCEYRRDLCLYFYVVLEKNTENSLNGES